MLLPEVGVKSIIIVEVLVVAMMASWMLVPFVLSNLVTAKELLLEEENGLAP